MTDEGRSSLGGSGLPGGLGRVVSVLAVAHEIAEDIRKEIENAGALRREIDKMTGLRGTADSQGSGEIESRLRTEAQKQEELFARDERERAIPGLRFKRHLFAGTSDESDEAERQQLRKDSVKTLTELAEKQERLNSVEQKQLTGSERQAALDKQEIEHREKLGRIAEAEAKAGVNNPAARDAENRRFELENTGINRRFDRSEIDQAFDEQSTGLRGDLSLTSRQRTLRLLGVSKLRADTRLANAGSDEERRKLLNESNEAGNSFQAERLSQYRLDHGEGGYDFAARNAERRSQRENASFLANDADREGRAGRGAYNDSSDLTNSSASSTLDAAAKTLSDAADKLEKALTNQ